jgi:hypothetical protein
MRRAPQAVTSPPQPIGDVATGEDPLAAPDAPIWATELLWEFFWRHPRRR